jgi:hypothetical protein
MNWDPIDDRISALVFIKNHILNNGRVNDSVDEAISFGVQAEELSIRMKFSNIAYHCKSLGINLLSKIKPLENNSIQQQEQFIQVKDFNLIGIYK